MLTQSVYNGPNQTKWTNSMFLKFEWNEKYMYVQDFRGISSREIFQDKPHQFFKTHSRFTNCQMKLDAGKL
jgi:hypothetical protein